jgi:HTH-type transcriptional regulator / antitoxin HipB
MSEDRSFLQLTTPEETQGLLAKRVKSLRRGHLRWSQAELARRAGVSLPTVSRFEKSGAITLENFLKVCFALGKLDDLKGFLVEPQARTMVEFEEQVKARAHKRGQG